MRGWIGGNGMSTKQAGQLQWAEGGYCIPSGDQLVELAHTHGQVENLSSVGGHHTTPISSYDRSTAACRGRWHLVWGESLFEWSTSVEGNIYGRRKVYCG